MTNIAAALKGEISRIARKEVRTETKALKKHLTQFRSQIAALKRQVAELQKQLRSARVAGGRKKVEVTLKEAPGHLRFRASGFTGHRKRLGLSAAKAGALLGVSGQTIYHWESGAARPRPQHMPAISALRRLTKAGAAAAIEAVAGRK